MSELPDIKIENLKAEIPILVGKRVRFLRTTKGITQTELGKLTQKDRQYIYKIEKGIVTANISTISILTAALDITLKEFFDMEDTL